MGGFFGLFDGVGYVTGSYTPPMTADLLVFTVDTKSFKFALNNLTATLAPTSSDDLSLGYAPGSIWLWRSNGAWVCIDHSFGAAVWVPIDASALADAALVPGASVDNAVPRFIGTSGKLLENTPVKINDQGGLEVLPGATCTGTDVAFRVNGGPFAQDFIKILGNGDVTFRNQFSGVWLRHDAGSGVVSVSDLYLGSIVASSYVYAPFFGDGTGYRSLKFNQTGIAAQIPVGIAADIGLSIEGAASQSAVLLKLRGTSSTTAGRNQVDLDTAWVDPTDATRKARFILSVWDTVARECIRLEASGSAAMLSFFGASAVVQPSGTGETTGFTAGSGTAVNDDSTFTGNIGSTAYRINDIVKALKQLGLLAQ